MSFSRRLPLFGCTAANSITSNTKQKNKCNILLAVHTKKHKYTDNKQKHGTQRQRMWVEHYLLTAGNINDKRIVWNKNKNPRYTTSCRRQATTGRYNNERCLRVQVSPQKKTGRHCEADSRDKVRSRRFCV